MSTGPFDQDTETEYKEDTSGHENEMGDMIDESKVKEPTQPSPEEELLDKLDEPDDAA